MKPGSTTWVLEERMQNQRKAQEENRVTFKNDNSSILTWPSTSPAHC